jgi:diguanylate cyclase (GGDEF)-like protein/PAS domain S-box-containing protein
LRVFAALAAFVFAGVSYVWMHFRLGGSTVALDYDDVVEWACAWLAAGTCIWVSRRGDARMRRFWTLVGASALAWGAGQAVWVYYEVIAGGQVPSPGLDDVGFLLAVPLMVAALLAFPLADARRLTRSVMLLDGALVGAATLFVSWALVLGPLYRAHQGGAFAQAVTLAYPASDVLIVVVLVSVAARVSRSALRPLGFVGAGVLALAFSDSAYAYLSQSGGYGSGLNVDIGWIVGFLLLALAPIWTSEAAARKVSAGRAGRLGLVLPYVPVAGGMAVAMAYLVSGRQLGSFLFADGLVVVVVLVGRQLLALRDSVSFSNEQAARFAALVQRSSDLTTIVAADGTIVYQSPSSATLLGRPAKQLEGRRFQELVHPDDAAAFLRALDRLTTHAGGETTSDWRLRHLDGHYIDAESRAVNLLADPNVRGVTINSRDISERRRLEEELRDQAVHDPLTGLANRTLLNDRLGHALAQRRRDHRDIAVLYVDLDDLKDVNDSLGHAAGDELLQEVARRLQSVVRAVDTVARLGGDEFAIVLDGISPANTTATADRILDTFKKPFLLDGTQHMKHSSVGIAITDSETTDAQRFLQQADTAMYAAKTSGKGRWETYRHGMHEQVLDHLQLLADLQHAVERDELAVFYQPIIALATETMVGVEALMRWQHPTRGLLAPGAFIPAAETSGLIVAMGHWLLRQACHDVRSWQHLRVDPPLKLNVNLSARQLEDPRLIADVADALAESHLEPSRLTLEITETAVLGDFNAAMAVLKQLNALGVQLAIDDFGTGYSSLSYLRQLPVQEVKIDQSFIKAMAENDESSNLVRTVIQLADDFHLNTVAEGVETLAQLEQLRDTDCVCVQGYLFAQPISGEDFREELESGTLNWPVPATARKPAVPVAKETADSSPSLTETTRS